MQGHKESTPFSNPFMTASEMTRIGNGVLCAAASSYGAALTSIQKKNPNGQTVELLWNGDEKHWKDRSPVLFPIVGRVKNGVYRYKDHIYSIESPHGFLQSTHFTKKETGEPHRMTFVLESNETTLGYYPFPFRFRTEYSLDGNTLRMAFDVHNTGTETMPFALGSHPGFFMPLDPSERFEDCSIRFEEDETPQHLLGDGVWMSDKSVPFPLKDRRVIPLQRSLFANDAVILDSVRKKTVSFCNSHGEPYVTMDYSEFRYLALWQPANDEPPFICLEAWNGLPDRSDVDVTDIMLKPEMSLLAPGQHYSASLSFLFP